MQYFNRYKTSNSVENEDFSQWIMMSVKCVNRKCKGCPHMELKVDIDENRKDNDIICVHHEECAKDGKAMYKD